MNTDLLQLNDHGLVNKLFLKYCRRILSNGLERKFKIMN